MTLPHENGQTAVKNDEHCQLSFTSEVLVRKHDLLKNKTELVDDNLTSCGIGTWRPKWLQVLNNPVYLLVNICVIGVVQSMAGSMIYSTMNTVEKRYAFDSKVSALIYVADNICSIVFSPIVGYYGIRYHRARLIGLGELVIALSCFLTASPFFIYGATTSVVEDLTSLSSSATNRSAILGGQGCTKSEPESCAAHAGNSGSTVWPAVVIFFVANFVRGIGGVIYYVIAMPFVDDNVDKKNSPIFLSVMQCILLVGPAIGFFFSAFCLRLFENPWVDSDLSPKDPRFIGAWWVGFVLVGVLLLITALPLFVFPAQFANAPIKAAVIKQRIQQSGGTLEATKRFLKNPLIILFFLGNTTRYFGVMGYYMFNAKYIEAQYRTSTSTANVFIGSASLVPIAIGILGGGMFISTFKPKMRVFFTFIFLVEFVSVLTIGSGIFLGCDPIDLVGTPTHDGTYTLQSSCNSNCGCTTRTFAPVCETATQRTYFSACHAGCPPIDSFNSTLRQCSCLSGTATTGYCQSDVAKCETPMYTYLVMMVVGTVVSSTANTGNMLVSYRSVEPMDKSFTSGVVSTLVSLFAFIPAPLIYGYIADSSCLVWESKCGKRGNCWVYDQIGFRNKLHIVTVCFLFLGSFFDFFMIFFADQMKYLYDDGDSQNDSQPTRENSIKLSVKS